MHLGKSFKLVFCFTVCLFVFLVLGCDSLADYGDTTPPVSDLSCSPDSPDGSNGWYRSSLSCAISSDDLVSGVKSINWRVDSNPWRTQSFLPNPNLAVNSSFEEGDGLYNIDLWEKAGSASFFHNSSNFFNATYSASINSSVADWSYWHNKINYAVARVWQDISVSVWVKTQNIQGQGAKVELYELTSEGEFLLAASSYLTGTVDWTRVSLNSMLVHEDAYGVYVKLGLDGVGTVWFDAITIKETPSDSAVSLILSQEGTHTLDYYAVDHENNQETVKNFNYKLDTAPPGNWRDFDVFRIWGSDHELYSIIRVSDAASGLQPFTDEFQYSVDAGGHWGYYSNLLSCSSTWNEGGWRGVFSLFPWPGVNDLLLVTPKIDYCNSNWAVCKIIRFRIFDMAGNSASTDVCINGAWLDSQDGMIGARANIEMSARGSGGYTTNDLVIAGGSYANQITSSNRWIITDYPMEIPWDYSAWLDYVPAKTAAATLPTSSGVYLIDSDLTITSSNIPGTFSTAVFSAVLFVNGNIRIRDNLILSDSSAMVFIISGDLDVEGQVTRVDGFYLVDGNFNSSYNGGNNQPALQVRGGVTAETFLLPRSLKNYDNIDNPAERFTFEPRYYELLRLYLGSSKSVFWHED